MVYQYRNWWEVAPQITPYQAGFHNMNSDSASSSNPSFEIGDIIMDTSVMQDDSWCNSFPSASHTSVTEPALHPSSSISGVVFDDTDKVYSLTLPTCPYCSDDDSSPDIWSASIEPITSYNYNDLKVTVDIANSQLRLNGRTGACLTSDVVLDLHFTLPDAYRKTLRVTI